MNEKETKEAIIRKALENIFQGIEVLSKSFKKEFTIDGRLVGDIGETLAALDYDIDLFDISQPDYDGISDGKKVQIKATFKESLTFKKTPERYLGLKLSSDGTYEEIYNGPGQIIYDHYKHRKGIGKVLLSFPNNELRKLSKSVSDSDRIRKR